MKRLVFILIFLAKLSSTSFASEKIFSCYRPINPYDPNFGQGQELFLDLFISDLPGTTIEMASMEGDKLIIKANEDLNYNEEQSTISLHFETGFISMVYLGGLYWGAYFRNDHDPQFPQENEFMCRELIDITQRL